MTRFIPPDTGPSDLAGCLTPRQFQVAILVADGQTNKQIAATLNLSLSRVKQHIEQIRRRLAIAADGVTRVRIAAFVTKHRAA